MADKFMKVRVRSGGAEFWRLCVEDAETGKHIPMMLEGLTLEIRDGVLVLHGDLMIEELDVIAVGKLTDDAKMAAHLRSLPNGGTFDHESRPALVCSDGEYEARVAARKADVPVETLDDFAARTVALITEEPLA